MRMIKSNQFQVTEAMQEVTYRQFGFLGDDGLDYLKLKVETLNPHSIRIKAVYQAPKQKPLVMEVLEHDFYKGVDQLAKKMKQTLKRQESKQRRRQDKLNLGLALSEIEAIEQAEFQNQLETIEVPIYQFTLVEALKQFNLFPFQVLMYEDLEAGSICTLVKQPDGSVKRYIGIR